MNDDDSETFCGETSGFIYRSISSYLLLGYIIPIITCTMNFKSILLLILLSNFAACSLQDSILVDIVIVVEQQCVFKGNSQCEVNLGGSMGLAWDDLYVFDEWTSDTSVKKATGIDTNFGAVPDMHDRIIFVRNGKIVYKEDYPWSKRIHFFSTAYQDGISPAAIFKSKKPFTVTKRALDDGQFGYVLMQE